MNHLCDWCGKSIAHYDHTGCTPAGEAAAELMHEGGPMDPKGIPAEIVDRLAGLMYERLRGAVDWSWARLDPLDRAPWLDAAEAALAAAYPLIQAAALEGAVGPQGEEPDYLVGVPSDDPGVGNYDDHVAYGFDAGTVWGVWAERKKIREHAAQLRAGVSSGVSGGPDATGDGETPAREGAGS